MRAVICSEYGPPEMLAVHDLDDLDAKSGQVRIAVEASGVNFPDGLIIQNKYQFKPELPFIPGSEVAGVVDQIGEGVTDLSIGDPVIGMAMTGGYASQIVIDAATILKRPANMPGTTAAGFMMTYGTSMHALSQRAKLASGETLLVLGAGGGVGLAAVEIGKAMGATVIAAASSPEKLAIAQASGADHLINYSEGDLRTQIKDIVGRKGIDVVYDPVGGDMFETAVRSMAWNGRALVVGFASGKIPSIPVNLTLLKGCSIVGVFWGAFRTQFLAEDNANFEQLIQWYNDGKLNPHISATMPLEDAPLALAALANRQVVGKIILSPNRQR